MSYRPRRAPHNSYIRLRGLDIHLTRWGSLDAPPWVFLHGFLDTSATFQFLVDAFEREHAVLAPDWRGFGLSAWGQGAYWFPDYLADLDALLEALAPEAPVALLGHSMGGSVAALYGGIRPERVRRIVNLEGFGLGRTRPEEAPARYLRWLEELTTPQAFGRYQTLEEFAAVLSKRNPRLTAERAAYIAASWARALPDGGYTVGADPAHKLVNPVLYRREEAEACWRRCRAPVLLVRGAVSTLGAKLGEDGSDAYYRSVYPDLAIAEVAAAGHMLHHEEPEALARLVEPFLEA